MTTTVFTDGVTLTQASWFNDADSETYKYLTGVAGTNTITATGPASLSAHAAGKGFTFIPANTNTGATTINPTCNSVALGAKNIFCNGAACIGGELRAGVPSYIIYDGTQYQMIGGYGETVGTSASTFTFNGSGGSTGSLTMTYQKIGKFVTLHIPTAQATTGTGSTLLTSNTALPAIVRPAANQSSAVNVTYNNGAASTVAGVFLVDTAGLITLFRDNAQQAWTNTAVGGTSATVSITYFLG